MVSQKILKALEGSSAIRAMFVEGKRMAEQYGAENVYDFSLGNPATPAPAAVNDAMRALLDESDASEGGSLELHGYMENAGYETVRAAIAENLNRRFGTSFDAHNLVMTVGAAGGLNIIFKTILDPGSEVIVFAPFFGEYRQYAANFDAEVVAVMPDRETFQPDLADFEAKLSPRTRALIVNTPNNPTGVIYKPETMRRIAEILERKQQEYGTDIYLISDEPYRELVYDGNREDFLTKYYKNTLVGYSFSKSLFLVQVPVPAGGAHRLCGRAGRGGGRRGAAPRHRDLKPHARLCQRAVPDPEGCSAVPGGKDGRRVLRQQPQDALRGADEARLFLHQTGGRVLSLGEVADGGRGSLCERGEKAPHPDGQGRRVRMSGLCAPCLLCVAADDRAVAPRI